MAAVTRRNRGSNLSLTQLDYLNNFNFEICSNSNDYLNAIVLSQQLTTGNVSSNVSLTPFDYLNNFNFEICSNSNDYLSATVFFCSSYKEE
ncbi:MAG: hypothetical protein ACFCUV_04775 [Rivularia sp. (in: cyanobacteria)]